MHRYNYNHVMTTVPTCGIGNSKYSLFLTMYSEKWVYLEPYCLHHVKKRDKTAQTDSILHNFPDFSLLHVATALQWAYDWLTNTKISKWCLTEMLEVNRPSFKCCSFQFKASAAKMEESLHGSVLPSFRALWWVANRKSLVSCPC